MDYISIVKKAGYKGDTAVYIARKLGEKQIPPTKLNQLSVYFRGTNAIAGISLGDLGDALYGAYEDLQNEPPKPPKKTAVKVEKEKGDS